MMFFDRNETSVEEATSFMNAVNQELNKIHLSEEAIDIPMALRYIERGYSIEDAVDDVCETMELMWDEETIE